MESKMYILLLAALIPMIMGSIWYSKPLFGKAWLKSIGKTEEDMKDVSMPKILALCYIFSVMIAFFLMGVVVHQFGFYQMLSAPDLSQTTEAGTFFTETMEKYGQNHRSFGHGVLHGVITGVFMILPVFATNALFERKTTKNTLINAGYWIVTLGLMGGVICAFL